MQNLVSPTPDQLMDAHTDITTLDDVVQIEISSDGKKVWINSSKVNIMRITGVTNIVINDNRVNK